MSADRFPSNISAAIRLPPHRPGDANRLVHLGLALGEALDAGGLPVTEAVIQGPIGGAMAPPPKKPFVVWAPTPWQLFARRVRTYLGLR